MSFLPGESIAFQRLLDKLKGIFEVYGFIPHSTSIFEKSESGQVYQIIDPSEKLTGMSLRSDHTVSLIEFVNKEAGRLVFPFKRYTTRPVYRPYGDESGYTEYHSCDFDVVGGRNLSIAYDAEIIALIEQSFGSIGLGEERGLCICINNRKIVNSFFKYLRLDKEKFSEFRIILDKKDDLRARSLLNDLQYEIYRRFIAIDGPNREILSELRNFFDEDFRDGISELEQAYEAMLELGVNENNLKIVPCLTRNMEYYNGLTFKVVLKNHPELGSLCLGGRYDISEEGFSGVGGTIQLTKLFEALCGLKVVEANIATASSVMVSGIGSIKHAMYISKRLREKGIQTEMFLDKEMEVDEQIEYAKKRGFKLFVWTDEASDRSLISSDIIKMMDLSFSNYIERRVMGEKAFQFFLGVELALGLKSGAKLCA